MGGQRPGDSQHLVKEPGVQEESKLRLPHEKGTERLADEKLEK